MTCLATTNRCSTFLLLIVGENLEQGVVGYHGELSCTVGISGIRLESYSHLLAFESLLFVACMVTTLVRVDAVCSLHCTLAHDFTWNDASNTLQFNLSLLLSAREGISFAIYACGPCNLLRRNL